MNKRAELLAQRIEQGAGALAAYAQGLSDANGARSCRTTAVGSA